MQALHRDILRTLLYYDIWRHPLNRKELYMFLPVNSMTYQSFSDWIDSHGAGPHVAEANGYYAVRRDAEAVASERHKKQLHSRSLWRAARLVTAVIRRFPFVRGVFVSGDLSKNATNPRSDLDFFIITKEGRLWIVRALLTLFKKTFLLNRKKLLCLNYLITEEHLSLDERNIFLAAEIAHLKPLSNVELFRSYLEANKWIEEFFPNFNIEELDLPKTQDRPSIIQKVLEILFALLPCERIDCYLMQAMQRIWARRYPQFDDATRERIFRSTPFESRAYVGNFEDKVLALYAEKLREFGIS
jgi:hypothetical protein